MKIEVIKSNESAWRAALQGLDHDTYHRYAYVCLEAERMGATPIAVLVRSGASALFLPLLVREIAPGLKVRDAISPYGYAGPLFSAGADPDFCRRGLREVCRALAALGICAAFVRGHPLIPEPAALPEESIVRVIRGETVWIDTSQEERLSWRGVRSSDKNRINKARRNGVDAEIDEGWSALPDFLRIYAQTMDRLRAQGDYYFGDDYFSGLRDSLGADALLCVVRHAGEVIGSGIFLRHEATLQFHLSGSRTELGDLSPARVMVDHMRRWATEHGIRAFHLGGGLGAQKDSLYEFKAGFSPLRAPFWTWNVICDRPLFEQAMRYSGKDLHRDSTESGYFPPYRAR